MRHFMTRSTALTGFVAVVALFMPASLQASSPFVDVSPIVMLLMDSSGSMEYDIEGYITETEDEDYLAVPDCSGAGGTYGKSRFIVASEVLTGSYVGYSCTVDDRSLPPNREDKNYPVDHIIPNGTQLENGLIDVTGRRFKFGLMTFDSVAIPGNGQGGGYSYGDETPINYGARNANAPTGPFVKPVTSDNQDDILAGNQAVEAALLATIPFGGTPIAPMLRDAYDFFTTDPDLKPYDHDADTGDMFYPCRSRNIILITDGRSNLGEAQEGYFSSTYYAQQLLQAGVKVYVIGFQLPAGVTTTMDDIASAGGTTSAFIAHDGSELAAVLSLILGNMEFTIQSRTKVVVTDDTGNAFDKQYQFNAAFGQVTGSAGLMMGYLERSIYSCATGNKVTLSGFQSLSEKLNLMADDQRTIWTAVGSQLQGFHVGNPNITVEDLEIPVPDSPGVVDLVDFRPTNDDVCGTGILGDAYEANVRNLYRSNLIRYVRADATSCRDGYKMGAIIHATPAIQGHLKNIDVMIPSFQTYKSRPAFTNRPTMLYTGTHDGQFHAFEISRPDGGNHTDWGKEKWSFIPNHILRQLKDIPTSRRPLMDGEPVVKDVLFSRTLSSLAAPEEEADDWRSVVISGYGQGGRGYFALDVTDPENPEFLWEISNEGRCAAGDLTCPNGTGLANDFSKLGYTVSKPAIGNVFLGNEEVAVAVFGAGSGKGLPGDAGRAVYVVRLDTGEKLEEFHATTMPDNVEDHCTGTPAGSEPAMGMVGDVTCYSTFPGTFITRCYLGDRAGRLWRVEMGSQSTANWKLQFFHDPYYSLNPRPGLNDPMRAPVLSAPGVAVKPYKNELVVVYGAGDTEAIEEFDKVTFIASLTETNAPEPECAPFVETNCRLSGFTAELNWKQFFGYDNVLNAIENPDQGAGEELKGEKLMGSPVLFSNVAYFVTFAPDVANACSPGVGWIWGLDYYRTDEDCMMPYPMLDLDGSALTQNDKVPKVRIGGISGKAIPFGLTVASRPSCFDGASADNAQPPSQCASCTPLANMGGSEPEIIVQTAVQSSASPDTISSGSDEPPTVAKMTRSVLNAVQSLFVGAWGFIFD